MTLGVSMLAPEHRYLGVEVLRDHIVAPALAPGGSAARHHLHARPSLPGTDRSLAAVTLLCSSGTTMTLTSAGSTLLCTSTLTM